MIALGKALAERIAPRVIWKHRIKSWNISTGEPEQVLLPALCDPEKLSLDIGAAAGDYLAHMLLHSSRVIAFEPRRDAAQDLRRTYANTPLVTIEEVALSDQAGSVQIRVPKGRPMLGTIDPHNALGDSAAEVYEVKTRRLDDYELRPVGFVKIDVEGHEQAVLSGATTLLTRERPTVLIEAEERHNPGSIAKVRRFFETASYSGFFFLDQKLHPMKDFDLEQHQNPAHLTDGHRTGTYINNFLFLQKEALARIPRHLWAHAP